MPAAPEWIFIGILALILFGPKKIPEIARGLGKALGELQRAKEDFHREITGVPPLPTIHPPGSTLTASGTHLESSKGQGSIPSESMIPPKETDQGSV